MTEPRRWNDAHSEAPRELRAALRVARTTGPSDAQLDALTSRLSAQLERERPQESEAPATEAAAVRAEVRRWIRRLYLTSMLTLALVVGTGLVMRGEPRPPEPAARRVLSAERLDSPPEASPPPASLPAPPLMTIAAQGMAEEQPLPTQPARGARRSTPGSMRAKPNGPVHVASESAASSIDDELALLFRARRLVSRDAPKALLLLREHAERFPRGPFQEEREALSIEALVAAGDGEAAARRYAEFRRRHPRSAYGTRLSTLLPAVTSDSARAE